MTTHYTARAGSRSVEDSNAGCCLATLVALPVILTIALLGLAIKLAFVIAVVAVVVVGGLWLAEALGADFTWFQFHGLQNPFNVDFLSWYGSRTFLTVN